MTKNELKKYRLIWALLLMIAYPFAVLFPFYDAYFLRHIGSNLTIPFDFSNALLFTSSILFGFSSLIIVSNDWVEWRLWAILLPPLALIILSGISVFNLALGAFNDLTVFLYTFASFNANVVSTGFIVGYVTIGRNASKASATQSSVHD